VRLAAGAFLLLLASCGKEAPVVIDGSSQQAFERTTAAARRNLPDAERLDYDRALASVRSRRFAANDPIALARTTFDGMTAEQVVADYRSRQ
jgi:hypothetical protein